MGVYRVDAVNIDWVGLLLSFSAFSIVAVCEEVLFRGILFRMIDERYGTLLAFIISSLTFGAAHLMTVDFWTAMAISAEAGFMLAAAYKFRNNLWIPIGIINVNNETHISVHRSFRQHIFLRYNP